MDRGWWERNGQPLIGSATLLALYAAVAFSCMGREPEGGTPEKVTPKESTTVRQEVSSMWHCVKCNLKLCDEDGRCPVWSSRDSRCYMLTKDEKKLFDIYEKTE